MEEYAAVVFAIFYAIAAYGLSPLGIAALAFVFTPDLPPSRHAMLSLLIGPALILVPGLVVAASDTGNELGFSGFNWRGLTALIIPAFLISFPLSFFLSKALRRFSPDSSQVFE